MLVHGAESVKVWIAVELTVFEEDKPVGKVLALLLVSGGGNCVDSGP